MTTVLCVPQWHGSASPQAKLLIDGAHRTAGLLGADTVVSIPPANGGNDIVDGIRAGGESERAYLRETGLRVYGADALADALETVTGPVYVHIDLDVLDPGEFGSVCYPEPRGVASSRLIELLAQLDNIVGAAITEHAPASDNAAEAAIIQRIGAALRR